MVGSGEGPLPRLQTAVFSVCPHLMERELASSLASHGGTNPIHNTPFSWPSHLPGATHSHTIILGVWISAYEFWGWGTQIFSPFQGESRNLGIACIGSHEPLNLCWAGEKEAHSSSVVLHPGCPFNCLEAFKNKTPVFSPFHSHPRKSDLIGLGDLLKIQHMK